MQIEIFDKIYDIRKNGLMILVKENSRFARLLDGSLSNHKRINYFDDPLKYLDHNLYEVLISDNQNKADIRYALFFILNDDYRYVKCVKGAVFIENRGIEIETDTELSETEKTELMQNVFQGTTLQELSQNYMSNNNYLIDLKNFMLPHDQSVLDKLAASPFKNLDDRYKEVARLMFLYRAEAVNRLADIRKYFPKVLDKPNNLLSLNATLSNIKDRCTNIKENAYNGFDCCMDSFMEELENNIEGLDEEYYKTIWNDTVLNKYFRLLLEQNFYKQLNERIRVKPDRNLYEIHMGKNWNSQNGEDNVKTLYITPRRNAR